MCVKFGCSSIDQHWLETAFSSDFHSQLLQFGFDECACIAKFLLLTCNTQTADHEIRHACGQACMVELLNPSTEVSLSSPSDVLTQDGRMSCRVALGLRVAAHQH
mmetsp:Transcript_87570/g.220312  ORF Transcript_87570/g.220312 Transcript_87570/m.220312 type:complete len:105 (+) Transcript_87570:757-1071(+)